MISKELQEILKEKESKEKHEKVIHEFLKSLNNTTDNYVLKGGTALMECYDLDRFSEDVDLDSGDHGTISKVVDDFCEKNGYQFRIAKDTQTVQRYMIHYDDAYGHKPLKVEISYRNGYVEPSIQHKVDGVRVYNINMMCMFKANAYAQRDKLRDLYDLAFIITKYKEQLTPEALEVARSAVYHKGIEQFDYLTRTQSDELINTDILAEKFLNMYSELGLDEPENQLDKIISEMENAWHDYFSLPKEERRGIEYDGEKLRPAKFEDLYLRHCKDNGTEPDPKINEHFWKNCVEIQEYKPQFITKEERVR